MSPADTIVHKFRVLANTSSPAKEVSHTPSFYLPCLLWLLWGNACQFLLAFLLCPPPFSLSLSAFLCIYVSASGSLSLATLPISTPSPPTSPFLGHLSDTLNSCWFTLLLFSPACGLATPLLAHSTHSSQSAWYTTVPVLPLPGLQ